MIQMVCVSLPGFKAYPNLAKSPNDWVEWPQHSRLPIAAGRCLRDGSKVRQVDRNIAIFAPESILTTGLAVSLLARHH